MGLPLGVLATKLLAPVPRPDEVPRPALLAAVRAGLSGRLVLITAPAGFGKTTLLAQWLASPDPRTAATAWLSVDAADNDPARFRLHLLATLDRLVPGAAEAAGTEQALT